MSLDPVSADIFKGEIQGLTFSPSLTVACTLYTTDASGGVYDPATATTSYPETSVSLNAFRAVVAEDQGADIRKGDVRFVVNPNDATAHVGDRITADLVDWYIYKVEAPDPVNALQRLYCRRSPAP